ncbi:hypothetical protein BJF93_05190 [Xaviernesmea oryzae]|uniref:Uncharacterized protein n=1 Tax=Xaviernesmea oryzae TaxID=464029 RepID=A0A1Q9AV19_9HYPH|nr:hypothetical protein BJF93_05190 [Xaviernesmea oryzae]
MRPAKVALLASAKIDEEAVKIVIRAYCEGSPPIEAIRRSGLSHVTVYRIYRYVRERLVAVEIYPTLSAFYKEMALLYSEGGPMFVDGPAMDAIDREVGQHRGVRPDNRPNYVSEKLYRSYGHGFTSGQLYRLVLLSAKQHGPLNRPVKKGSHHDFDVEFMRILADQLHRSFRRQNRISRDEGEDPSTFYQEDLFDETIEIVTKVNRKIHRKMARRKRRRQAEDKS